MDMEIKKWTQDKMNSLMEEEIRYFLRGGGSRNGYYKRRLDTAIGSLKLRVPRDRKGKFHTELFLKYQRQDSDFLLSLYKILTLSLGVNEKRQLIYKNYGIYYGRTFLTRLTNRFNKEEKEKDRQIKNQVALFLDGTYIKVKGVSKCLMFIIGMDEEKRKRVLNYRLNDTENINDYKQMFEELKAKGLKKVDLIVSDGFIGLERAVLKVYNGAEYQRCVKHFVEYTKRAKATYGTIWNAKEEKENFITDLMKVIRSPLGYKESEREINRLYEKHINLCTYLGYYKGKLKTLIAFKRLKRAYWKSTYTTNIIECFNHHLKKNLKAKEYYRTVESLLCSVRHFCINSSYW